MANKSQIEIVTNLATRPADVINGVKAGVEGGSAANYLSAMGSALTALDALVATMKNVPVLGNAAIAASLGGDLGQAYAEWNNGKGSLSDATWCSLAADATALIGMAAAGLGCAPGIIALAAVAGASLTVAALFQDEGDTTLSDALPGLVQATQDAARLAGQAEMDSMSTLADGTDQLLNNAYEVAQAAGGAEQDAVEAMGAGTEQLIEGLSNIMQAAGQADQDSAEAMADGVDKLLNALADISMAAGTAEQDSLDALAAGTEQLLDTVKNMSQTAWNALREALMQPYLDETMEAMRDMFQLAEQQASPLILDLDGDGVETLGLSSRVYFDHDGNGFAEQTGWVAADDGLLVMDRNNNGLIETGTELFGNNTLLANGQKATNGFAALSELDANRDGRIDAQDAAYADLRVWKDANGNGVTENGELLTLAEAGVQAIATVHAASTLVDANNNAHKQIGSFTTADGQTRSMNDVWFAMDSMHAVAIERLDIPEGVAALTNLHGYDRAQGEHI